MLVAAVALNAGELFATADPGAADVTVDGTECAETTSLDLRMVAVSVSGPDCRDKTRRFAFIVP